MAKRYVAIWFRYLLTDWTARRRPELQKVPFVLAQPQRGRMVITAANPAARAGGVRIGMVLADGRAIVPGLQVLDAVPGQAEELLDHFARWFIRYTPVVAPDPPDGLLLDSSGCAHLWGGEVAYLEHILSRLAGYHYAVRAAMADTAGAAWAVARFGRGALIVPPGEQEAALLPLPAAALRLEPALLERLDKLGLRQIRSFIHMPRGALRRRFGPSILARLDQALGREAEPLLPVKPLVPYEERLPAPEPIRTPTGIEIALRRLLEALCYRLEGEGKGVRSAVFKAYRIDGQVEQIAIGTARASRHVEHLFRLFALKIPTLAPGLGIELFVLEAPAVEDTDTTQEALWEQSRDAAGLAELLDRLAGKLGIGAIHRYLPDAHYLPERSFRAAASGAEQPAISWRTDLPRPVHLLPVPEPIEVSVPLPDYPPMLFRYKGQLHEVKKADGPERIEGEWWIEAGRYRDYYCLEDAGGARFWVFRLGDYQSGEPAWFLHGFFA